jgi:glycerophosphoryl diester phosphodiesterase
MIRVGHKGADLIRPGNTLESFLAAEKAGVDVIEIDVLWRPDGHPRIAAAKRTPLLIAHDWGDAEARTPLTLAEALDAFASGPLCRLEFDLDLKLPGREAEIVEALRERDLIGRAMVSTMERSSLARIGELCPALRRGWTYPKVRRDWASKRWARAPMWAALALMRRQLPALAARDLPRLGVQAMWVYHPLISARLAEITKQSGVKLIAWTVDDLARMRRLIERGVDGLCSNDPRLFALL